VYNTLSLFEKKNIAGRINIDENEIRFDLNTDNHAHFKCISCKKIFDIKDVNIDINNKYMKKYKILKTSVFFQGYAKNVNGQIRRNYGKNKIERTV